jgi:DNA-binding GntR family transcriptional regulator
MTLEQIHRIEPRTLKEDVTNILRQMIIDGELAPDAELNQVGIANQLGVSRGPVREALGQLEQEGLVHSIPYKGVFVTSLTRRHVEELYSIRIVLETLAVERAIDRITEEDLAKLNQIVDEMSVAAKDQNLQRLVEVDLDSMNIWSGSPIMNCSTNCGNRLRLACCDACTHDIRSTHSWTKLWALIPQS